MDTAEGDEFLIVARSRRWQRRLETRHPSNSHLHLFWGGMEGGG